ncbi:Chaperone protein DnaK [Planctomycetes bacterium Pan216]|uniref:Chaperone protein DnaK n=1 Tax=Kolteria novifilia TaxID=2527975 RepID=A0A518B5R7_9BACT|nr:Chaperone protein DnaK [Planctomycetes bacterium Pan216]
MPDQDGPLIGIDLGTTYCAVATIDPHGRPSCLQNGDGDLTTPSVVYFEEKGPAIVGKEALKAGLSDPEHMVDLVKREMGKEFYHKPIRDKKLPPSAISGVILHRLIEDAQASVGPFKRAVVTVPAYFNEPRRKATIDAAHMAGLEQVELLNEPTAAALAFGFEMGAFTEKAEISQVQTKIPGQFHLLVYDLGGGTFDVTLMRIKDRHFQALVCDGDVQLGGKDWDMRLVKDAIQAFHAEFELNLAEDAEVMADLTQQVEDLKRTLSQRERSTLRLNYQGKKLNGDITRDHFRSITADLLGRTRLTCELVMMEAKMDWDKMDAILLVGGSSRMPMVHDMLVDLTGIEPSRTVSPDLAVAQGAALYAQMLWGSEESTEITEKVRQKKLLAKITDVNSHSMGVVGWDRKTNRRKVSVIIPKNTPIPHSNSKVFRTKSTGQSKIFFQIVEGESHSPEDCALIGECRLVGLPKNLPADWPVTITFAYRRDGRIFVEAAVKGSEPFQLEIDRNQKISDAELEDWASELIGDFNADNGFKDRGASGAEDPDVSKSRAALPPSKITTANVSKKTPPKKG